jgi:hypothetical protein
MPWSQLLETAATPVSGGMWIFVDTVLFASTVRRVLDRSKDMPLATRSKMVGMPHSSHSAKFVDLPHSFRI